MLRILIWSLVVSGALSLPGWAQKPSSPVANVNERREQLARDLESIADGDPVTRVVTMEDILKRGDASAAFLAMRTALASDDPALKNIALRAWFASAQRLNLKVLLPDNLQKQVNDAFGDPKASAELFKSDSWLTRWGRRGFQLALGFMEVDVSKASGQVWSPPYNPEPRFLRPFSIAGNQVFISISIFFGPGDADCHITLSPSQSLTLEGTVSCEFGYPSPTLRISAPMF